jgi:hypothetical protein
VAGGKLRQPDIFGQDGEILMTLLVSIELSAIVALVVPMSSIRTTLQGH